MADKTRLASVLYRSGVAAFLVGTLDPMEGSVLIAIGSALLALSLYLSNEREMALFFTAMVLIVSGVLLLFFFSALGGFGGNAELPVWMGFFLLPYPIGWFIIVVLLIRRTLLKKQRQGKLR